MISSIDLKVNLLSIFAYCFGEFMYVLNSPGGNLDPLYIFLAVVWLFSVFLKKRKKSLLVPLFRFDFHRGLNSPTTPNK